MEETPPTHHIIERWTRTLHVQKENVVFTYPILDVTLHKKNMLHCFTYTTSESFGKYTKLAFTFFYNDDYQILNLRKLCFIYDNECYEHI